MRADHDQQQALLALQQVDNQIRRLRHRVATTADAAATEAERRADETRRALVNAQTELSDLGRAIRRSEEEVERVRRRLERDRELAGAGASARVQRDLEHELGSLQRRLGDLEDEQLALLERQEELAAGIDTLAAERAQWQETATRERERVAAQAAQDAADLAGAEADRAVAAGRIEPGVLNAYERIRRDTPVAAAELVGHQCGGCRLELPPADLAELLAAPAEELVTCPECECLLVRGGSR